MRCVKTMFLVALVGVWFMAPLSGVLLAQAAKPAKKKAGPTLPEAPPPETLGPGDAVVRKGGKVFKGWINPKGKIGINNDYGRTIYSGQVDRMGGAEIHDATTGVIYRGRVNPMGTGRLFDLRSGESIRIEILR